MPVDVSIIIVSYNTRAILLDCLASIYQWLPSRTSEIIVIDNASIDGSAEAVAQRFANVMLLRNAENIGFAAANNQGIQRASGQFLLLLNPDTFFIEDAISPLIAFMEQHAEAGMAGCKILNRDGSLQPSYFPLPNLASVLWTAFFFDRLAPLNHVNGKWVLRHQPAASPFRVQRLLGAFLFVRREVFKKIGGFDEGFFLYSEEEDLCYRVLQLEWVIYYFPQISIIHLGGQSAPRTDPRAVVYANESKVRFFRKHYGPAAQLLFRSIWFVALIIRMPAVLWLAPSKQRAMFKAYQRSLAALFQPLTAIRAREELW